MHHKVMHSNQSFEHHHPAAAPGFLTKNISQMFNTHISFIYVLYEI